MGNETHDFMPEMGDQEGPQQGPSWGNPRWLAEVVDSDADLTAALNLPEGVYRRAEPSE